MTLGAMKAGPLNPSAPRARGAQKSGRTIARPAGRALRWETSVRESKIEAYLVRRVRELGGEIRKVSWVGRRGAPDRFVMMPGAKANFWAELKAPGKKAEPHQEREHNRLVAYGEIVHVIDSMDGVDAALAATHTGRRI